MWPVCPGPVIVTTGRVVVGVSQSMSGLAAIRYAVAQARSRHQPAVYAVRAWPYPPTTRGASSSRWEQHLQSAARAYVVAAFGTSLGAAPEDLDVVVTAAGRPAPVLKELANRDSDLLVVGAAASRWWPGATVAGCTRAAVCPVIVVPAPELARHVRGVPMRRLVAALTNAEHATRR